MKFTWSNNLDSGFCFVWRGNHIGGVTISVLFSSAVDRGFDPRTGQTKDYEIGICCFSAKHATLRKKDKDWLARNQDKASKWGDMAIRGLLYQWAIKKNPTKRVGPAQRGLIIISLKINLFSPWYSWTIAELALNSNHSLTLFREYLHCKMYQASRHIYIYKLWI
jgi:hypothetical protein